MQIHDALVQRIIELAETNNRTITNLTRSGGSRQSTMNEFIQGRTAHPQINTILLYCQGCGITLREFFDSPLFDSLESPKKKK